MRFHFTLQNVHRPLGSDGAVKRIQSLDPPFCQQGQIHYSFLGLPIYFRVTKVITIKTVR